MHITWSGVLALEEAPTTDGRYIDAGALSWPELPITLRIVMQDTGGHKGAVAVGTVETITRDPDNPNILHGAGTFDADSETGLEAARLAATGIKRGISIDPSAMESDIEMRLLDGDGNRLDPTSFNSADELPDDAQVIQAMTSGRIRGATIVDMAAFEEAKITEVLVHDDDQEDEQRPGHAITAAAMDHDGAMVALIPDDPAAFAVDGFEPAEALHVTLVFLGDAADYAPEERDRLEEAVTDVFSEAGAGPVTGNVWASANFNPTENPAAVYLVGGTGLTELHHLAIDATAPVISNETDATFPEQHEPWVPHITVGYGDLDASSLDSFGEVTFSTVRLSFAPDDIRDIPLGEPIDDEPVEEEPVEEEPFAVTAAAVEPHSTQVASPDVDWDGTEAEKSLPSGEDSAFYAQFYAYQNPDEDGTAKDHWHYIHHFVEGVGSEAAAREASLEACHAIIGLLNGARGVNVQVKGEDRQVVYDHMAKHMRDGGEDPPPLKPESTAGQQGNQASAASKEDTMSEYDLTTTSVTMPSTESSDADADPAPATAEDDCSQVLGLTASAASIPQLPSDHFSPMDFAEPTPLTLDDDGHVYGHVALDRICHVGYPKCVTMPHSESNLRYFHTGVVRLDDGSDLATGRITVRGSHASPELNWRSAMAHYEDTSTVVADVVAYEDAHGIAVTGHLRPGTPSDLVHAFRGSTPSGDWRRIGNSAELINVHMVNSPGFPVYRTDGNRVETTIAASAFPAQTAADADLPDDVSDEIAHKVVTILENNRAADSYAAELAPARDNLAERLASQVRAPLQ